MTRLRGEDGMTLVEVTIVIIVLGVIVPIMTGAIILGLQTAEGTADRVALSHDAKLTGIYLVPDIQSAQTVTLESSTCTDASGTTIASFGWVDDATSILTTYVATDGTHDLVRTVCHDDVVQPDLQVTVAHHLSDADVTAACTPGCAAAGRSVSVDVELCGRIPSGPAAGTCRADTTYAFEISARSRGAA